MAKIRAFAKKCAFSLFTVYAWMRIKLLRNPTLLILTYHRVLPLGHPERNREQPGMMVTPELLQRHIQFVKSLGAVPIHLDEWVERKESAAHELPILAVAFTFDDGWRDNYLYAYPILKKEQVPATIFLVTGMTDTPDTFWPERILRLLRTGDADLSDPELSWLKSYLGNWDPEHCFSLTEADEAIDRLKALDDATIIKKLDAAEKNRCSRESEQYERAILSTPELSEMAQDALVKYGAHTRQHFRLNRLESKEALNNQIIGCLNDLKEMPVGNVPIFCYPNGDISPDGERLVAKHYDGACTTKTGWNPLSQSVYDLHRFNLHDGNSGTNRSLLATIGRGLFLSQI